MSTLKNLLSWLFVAVITPLYSLLIILNLFSASSAEVHMMIISVLPIANTIAAIAFVPVIFLLSEIGIPCYKKCKKCGSRIQIYFEADSGRDASHPEYEHAYRIRECLSCHHRKTRHITRKVEEKNITPRMWW
jgi:hypothetical protein